MRFTVWKNEPRGSFLHLRSKRKSREGIWQKRMWNGYTGRKMDLLQKSYIF